MSIPAQKPGRSKQDYVTPSDFIVAVKELLGVYRFSHDFAADATNKQAPTFFDEETDALSVPKWELTIRECGADWRVPVSSPWGWLNPPFANIGPWAKRCMETGKAGGHIAFLVPAGVGANWFRDYVDGHARVLFLNGRLAFMQDKPKWLYPKDCILCLYGPAVTPGYQVWNWRSKNVVKVA